MYCLMDHPARTAGRTLCERVGWKFEPLTIPVFQLDMVPEMLTMDAAILNARVEAEFEMETLDLADT